MKKILFFAFAASIMASCTTDEVLDLHQNPIVFSDVFVDNSTRAIDNSFSSTNKPLEFYVYGTTQGDEANAPLVPIFKHVEVKYNDNTQGETWNESGYNYDAAYTQYWIDGNTYNFAALVNAEQSKVVCGDNKLPFKLDFISNSMTDLLYAEVKDIEGQASGNEMVGFTFNHLLSKVHVTFKNGITTNSNVMKYGYKVTDVKIDNAIQNATCILASELNEVKWTAHSNNFTVSFGNINNASSAQDVENATEVLGIQNAASATSRFSRLLIPGEYTGGDGKLEKMTLIFTVETLINGSSVDIRDEKLPINCHLEPGHAYNFIITKDAPGEPIKFTVTDVRGWKEPVTNVPEQN